LLQQRNYAALVRDARLAPERGSYTLAAQALAQCIRIKSRGDFSAQLSSLMRSTKPDALKQKQVAALRALYAPCDELGSVEQMGAEAASLQTEAEAAHDALAMLTRAQRDLGDSTLPQAKRQEVLASLLALDDVRAYQAATSALTTAGATFEGAEIPEEDLAAYRTAFNLAVCGRVGQCGGPDTTVSHADCLLHGQCDYLDAWGAYEAATPPYIMQAVPRYYARIQNDLAQNNFAAFGVAPAPRRYR
jgi:hypothetical protein